jgi:hypothetical protein
MATATKLTKLPEILSSFMPTFATALATPLLMTWDDEVDYHEAEQPAAIGRVLVKALHVHLREAKVGYLFRKDIKHRGVGVFAQASKIGGKLAHYSHLDLLVEVSWMRWTILSPARRVALIDHELSHFGREETDKGETKYLILPHDLEEFDAIARRWGAWRPQVASFGNALGEGQQLGLFTHD